MASEIRVFANATRLYTLAYSKPYVEAVNWYDFLDGQDWIENGGLVRDNQGDRKPAFLRLKRLQEEWGLANGG